ncbi:MAG: glycerol-3-phosphate acyltransferase [Chloroflexi bacterium]|nr:MAG: glycerol-3-phosphate acyltransferase [Chloroflexota bacterium]
MRPEQVILVIVLGYIIGSFPTAYLVARSRGVDIFKVGSGNMGANNVARALGPQYGALVWIVDGSKGILAILLARWILSDNQAAASSLAAVSAVAGHNWSLLATLITGSIRGGKGAATASGTFLLLAPTLLIALVLAVGAVIVLLTRYVSLAVLTSVAVAGIAFLILVLVGSLEPGYVLYLLVSWMVFVRHRSNIVNLLAGKERRWGERA